MSETETALTWKKKGKITCGNRGFTVSRNGRDVAVLSPSIPRHPQTTLAEAVYVCRVSLCSAADYDIASFCRRTRAPSLLRAFMHMAPLSCIFCPSFRSPRLIYFRVNLITLISNGRTRVMRFLFVQRLSYYYTRQP